MRKVQALVAALVVMSLSWVSMPAHASTSYTPDGGPEVYFGGTGIGFTNVQANQELNCAQFDLSGEMLSPGTSRPFGANSKKLGSLVSSGCTNPIAGLVSVVPVGEWEISVTGEPTGTTWPGELRGVNVAVSAAGCTFNVTGSVGGTFDTVSQVLAPTSSELVISEPPSGFLCPILGIAQGQDIEIDGHWTNVPPTGSTQISLTAP